MDERGLTFKEAVNSAIRQGLDGGERSPVEIPTRSMGLARIDLDRAIQLLGAMEDEEVVRTFELRK